MTEANIKGRDGTGQCCLVTIKSQKEKKTTEIDLLKQNFI